MKAQLRAWRNEADGTSGELVWFWCAPCNTHHAINPKGWTWNGDTERPTFSPSVLVNGFELSAASRERIAAGLPPESEGRYEGRDTVCHSFVRDGRIQYLGDSTHTFAGQTLPLEDLHL